MRSPLPPTLTLTYIDHVDDATSAENAVGHEKWCNDLSAKFLCVFVLDRFGDFVSDQVVAPVRETVSQTLASLLLHMPRRSVSHVHAILLQMIQQDLPVPLNGGGPAKGKKGEAVKGAEGDKTLIWEVRHAGLLGIKYEVAVRSDLFARKAQVKAEVEDVMTMDEDVVKREEESEFDETGREVLRGVVEAAILGLGDRDDDVRSVAASCLLPVAEHIVAQLPEALDRVLVVLWHCLCDMKDDLSSSVGAVMDLLGWFLFFSSSLCSSHLLTGKLVSYEKVISILADDTVS